MSLIDYFRSSRTPKNASIAKERLQILVAHERLNRNAPDYLQAMQQDIIKVIQKYVPISDDQVQVALDNDRAENVSVLELNITLPGR